MATCYLWATLMSPQVADVLITGLVKRGWQVGPLSADKQICFSNPASTLAVIQIEGVGRERDMEPLFVLMSATKEVLKDYNYFSLLVYQCGKSFAWNGGNIKLPAKPDMCRTALDLVAGDGPLDDENGSK